MNPTTRAYLRANRAYNTADSALGSLGPFHDAMCEAWGAWADAGYPDADEPDTHTSTHGPCDGGGDPVRDHLPESLPKSARAFILARLNGGEAKYGTVLRVGWTRADEALREELADAVAYAVAGGRDRLAEYLGGMLGDGWITGPVAVRSIPANAGEPIETLKAKSPIDWERLAARQVETMEAQSREIETLAQRLGNLEGERRAIATALGAYPDSDLPALAAACRRASEAHDSAHEEAQGLRRALASRTLGARVRRALGVGR